LKPWVQDELLESIQRLNGIQALADECLGCWSRFSSTPCSSAYANAQRKWRAGVACADDAVRAGGRGLAIPMSSLPQIGASPTAFSSPRCSRSATPVGGTTSGAGRTSATRSGSNDAASHPCSNGPRWPDARSSSWRPAWPLGNRIPVPLLISVRTSRLRAAWCRSRPHRGRRAHPRSAVARRSRHRHSSSRPV